MKKANKKLLTFWIIAGVFLICWSFYWLKIKPSSQNEGSLANRIEEAKAAYDIWSKISQKDGQEKTFLLLFQNDMEIRPSGGYIGTFGILKIKDGQEIAFGAHNTNNFDGRVPDGTPVPYPMEQMLRIKHWKMRDANWYPDFKDSALQAEKFYKEGQGEEDFYGVIGINSQVLSSFLEITGPIEVEGVDEPFTNDNAVMKLEYLVEQGYEEIGNAHKDRKQIISDLARKILEKTKNTSFSQKIELLKLIEKDLNNKEIQMFFKDSELQAKVEAQNWGGRVDTDWNKNYLMLVDANLGALKSNRLLDYSAKYSIDLSKEKPEATLKIALTHKGQEKDWLTKNYQSFLRIYAPQESWLLNVKDFPGIKFSEEYNKKVFGVITQVPLGETREFEFHYTFGEKAKAVPFEILLQKQSGMKNLPIEITLTKENGEKEIRSIILEKDNKITFE